MAITVNAVTLSTAVPSAPQRVVTLDVDLDASYPTGGYDVTASLAGGAVTASETATVRDGTTVRHMKVSPAGLLQVIEDDFGAAGAETTAAADLSLYTGKSIFVHTQ